MSAAAKEVTAPTVRLGFLGLGWIGRNRLEALTQLDGMRIAALADVNAAAVDAIAAKHPDAQRANSLDELLAMDLDGVVIATPSGQHAEQAIAVLERGLPVFCQKPLATSAADAQRVVDAARRADRLLAVDLSYRYVSGMEQLRERIRTGELGDIQAIDLTFHNCWGPDKSWCMDRSMAGGGCVLDLGVHLLDLALWLQDFPSTQVVARSLFSRGQRLSHGADGIEDFAYADLQQTSGAAMRIACSWNLHAGQDAIIGMRIHGTKAGAEWRNVNGSFYDFELDLLRSNSRERLGGHPDAWGARAVQRWAEAVQAGMRFDPGAANLVASAQLIDAIYR
jgi:predicted dehydrogenase